MTGGTKKEFLVAAQRASGKHLFAKRPDFLRATFAVRSYA
jgi:hypothetical protein